MEIETEVLVRGALAAQCRLAAGDDMEIVLQGLLATLVAQSESAHGCISEILDGGEDQPSAPPKAITRMSSKRRYFLAPENGVAGIGCRNFRSLVDKILINPQPIMVMRTRDDPWQEGLLAGVPPLLSLMGLPIFYSGELVGVLGLADRSTGYSPELIERLEPLLETCAHTIVMCRTRKLERRAAQEADVQLRHMTRHRDQLLQTVSQMELSSMRSPGEPSGTETLLGKSAPMIELYQEIADVARGDWNVLIRGETGVGKELVARAIHVASPRRAGPYIAFRAGKVDRVETARQGLSH